MRKTLGFTLAVLTLFVGGCSKDDFILVTDLEITNVEITGDTAAFCAGTSSLQLKFVGKKKQWHTNDKKPEYVPLDEPCSAFTVKFNETDKANGAGYIYTPNLAAMDSQCQVRLPKAIAPGFFASGEVTHYRMTQPHQFSIACP